MAFNGIKRSNPVTRFWSKVNRRGMDECWTWLARVNHARGGYGVFYDEHRVAWRAHRYAWKLAHSGEEVPPLIRHSCDNPPCCNPSHLLAGTQKQNLADAIERGRMPRGVRCPQSKLNDQQVQAIRALYDTPRYRRLRNGGIRVKDIARQFGVSPMTVVLVGKRKIWRHVA